MPRHRFFVEPERLASEPILLEGDLAHQLARVLRLSPGDLIELLDNSGRAWVVRLDQVTPRQSLAIPLRSYHPQTEPGVRMVLYQALPKGRKFDLVLQKSAELGASSVVPMQTARSTAPDRSEGERSRGTRWRRILQEAAEQSGRARIPDLAGIRTLTEALTQIEPGDLSLIGSIEGEAHPIRRVLQDLVSTPVTVRLFVGPEGGFDLAEVQQAQAAGAIPVSLGPRVLRTETAGLAMLAILGYALGEMEAAVSDEQD